MRHIHSLTQVWPDVDPEFIYRPRVAYNSFELHKIRVRKTTKKLWYPEGGGCEGTQWNSQISKEMLGIKYFLTEEEALEVGRKRCLQGLHRSLRAAADSLRALELAGGVASLAAEGLAHALGEFEGEEG